MNALHMAKTAYTTNSAPIRTPRGTEYEAFARVTHRIKSAAEKGRAAFPELVAALHANRQLWTMLAADVAEDGNGLPESLRARVFYLAEFTVLHSSKVLRGEAEAEVLIEINTAIMRGLRGTTEAA
ncbi:flagellar biosynthesis regulator FlaF [Sinisalibacter lacisalsi]|uniref:Flagellar biosynthesis regulatory protein FlaF n=1 Tax=Sinisalibacter lacisalsi TaxID=1526570 RepID=A0ABQ1QE20_9RHOB|nr:flagellar biosynthesis regulator FlaF [Sinisalibacter lacisalsi]GGD22932.1 flagellar biosynthesis regulatory protein FlaF [Sinisalibacter lacisalsi]